MKNEGKNVLITGPTSGIGRELARLFANDGYNIVLVARNQQELEATAAELSAQGVETFTIAKDLFNPLAAFEVYDEVKAQGIEINVLVNNAGQGIFGQFADTDLQRELDIIQLNTASLVVLTKSFLRDMLAKGSGKILNLASIASKTPGPWQSVYHATKAFVLSFSEAIRSELEETGVTITALMPGVTDTDFFKKAEMENSKALDGEKADPAKVAKDGYDALMNGDDKVVSGLKNKAQVAMANVMPDSLVADNMKKQQAPRDNE